MNEPVEPNLPPQPEAAALREPSESHPMAKPWLRRLLACNPFYLVSVALLLYGCYRISLEPNLFNRETAHLIFNFSSLQCYEALLAVTAIFLARRKIWYDSTLLVCLENMLVLVPFILISQAALIDRRMLWLMCVAGGFMAMVRFGGIKGLIAQLNFPTRLTGIGLILLLVNVALPVVYRVLHESKVGNKPDWGAAYHTNQCAWMLVFPALCCLAALIPTPRSNGELWPQRPWLPLAFFGLWLAGTGVHLYCLGYVYDFSLRGELLAPAIWMLLWLVYRRASDFVPGLVPDWQRALIFPPLAATLVAFSAAGNKVFLTLTLLNLVIYGSICLRHRGHRLALHCLLMSLAALVAGCPEAWGRTIVTDFSRITCIAAAIAIYFILWAIGSSSPQFGILGGLVSALVVLFTWRDSSNTVHWALQAGLVFLLLHSLRWPDSQYSAAKAFRRVASVAWVAHAFLWMHLTGQAWMACASATVVLVVYLLARFFRGHWSPAVLAVAGILVLFSGPGDVTVGKVRTIPVGVLASVGSFLLFGLGTLAALTRHHWHKAEPSS